MRLTTKQYLIPLTFGSIIAVAGLIAILLYIDPFTANWLTLLSFYLLLFLSISGSLSIINLVIRKRFFPGIQNELIKISLRQSILVALLGTGMIYLEVLNLLFWWVSLLLVLILIFIELFLTAN